LHGAAFACLAASFVVFCFTHEGSHAPRGQLRSLSGLLREAPALARSSRSFWRYLWARIPLHGIFVLIPFLGNHALAELRKPDAYLGTLLAYHLLGSLAGYFIAGYSGDRHGGRLSLLAAHGCWLVVAAVAPFASSEMAFQALFGLLGAGLSMSTVALSTLDLEITPPGQRVALQAVLGVFTLLGLTGAALLAAALRGLSPSLWVLSGPTLALVSFSGAMMLAVEEPRTLTYRA
jgi:predicted MFS family arabinose efflux permease